MLRKITFLFIVLALFSLLIGTAQPALAQDDAATATADIETNLRVGPGTNHAVITVLQPGTTVTIEGRTQNQRWILIKLADGTRGWGFTRLFRLADGVKLSALPVSTEVLTAVAPAPGGGGGAEPPAPNVSGTAPLNTALISLGSPGAMRAIAAKGRSLGNNPRAFSKVGDCMSAHWAFLSPLGWGQVNFDNKYGGLQDVINYFNVSPREGIGSSWDAQSLSAHDGFNSAAVLDPIWSDKVMCGKDENALECEYRLVKPAVAVIMFGTADVLVMSTAQFNKYLRDVVKRTMDRGIVPILTTFPENSSVQQRSRQINQIVVRVARENGLPLINLADAIRDLPGGGIDSTGLYLTIPPTGSTGDFTPSGLQYGYNVRNLLTLQALDAVWRQILN